MVYDFQEGRILGEIGDLEEEIRVIEALLNFYTTIHEAPDKQVVITRTLARLQADKEHQERRLEFHRERIRDSGIKF